MWCFGAGKTGCGNALSKGAGNGGGKAAGKVPHFRWESAEVSTRKYGTFRGKLPMFLRRASKVAEKKCGGRLATGRGTTSWRRQKPGQRYEVFRDFPNVFRRFPPPSSGINRHSCSPNAHIPPFFTERLIHFLQVGHRPFAESTAAFHGMSGRLFRKMKVIPSEG